MLLTNILVTRRRGDVEWSNLFNFIACYGVAILINSSFDVALEGPMLGLWFWCLFGMGISSVMIYRVRSDRVMMQRSQTRALLQCDR